MDETELPAEGPEGATAAACAGVGQDEFEDWEFEEEENAPGEDEPADEPRTRRPDVKWSAELGRAVCAKVAAGETQVAICRQPGMPSRATLFRWNRDKPPFARRLAKARAAAGRKAGQTKPSSFCPVTANEIFERMCEGQSVSEICRDPAMPSFSAVYHWRRDFPEFAEMMRTAREVQAERYCEQGIEIAEAVTPETAHATRVRLSQLRWTASHYWPRAFGTMKAVAPPEGPQVVQLLMRRFEVEVRDADGARRVVTYTPDPETGRAVRTAEGEWSAPRSPAQLAAVAAWQAASRTSGSESLAEALRGMATAAEGAERTGRALEGPAAPDPDDPWV